jgi:replicative DNA helicase
VTHRYSQGKDIVAEPADSGRVQWFDEAMNEIVPMTHVLATAHRTLQAGLSAAARVWPTGFKALDDVVDGGLRAGELVLLAGPQGMGKTTLALQAVRNIAAAGDRALYLSFEHDAATLLIRLLALELGESADPHTPTLADVRAVFENAGGLARGLPEALTTLPGGRSAYERVASYADRLLLVRASGRATDLGEIGRIVARIAGGAVPPVVVVDYLQKVAVPNGPVAEDERVTLVVEGLKDLALAARLPVIAVSAADKEGLRVGRRLRVRDLRGSTALGYEADIVLVLNDKYDIVARHHLVYDVGNAERFREWSVLSVEKNRAGPAGIDLEFHKELERARYAPEGGRVAERLVDERVYVQ